jgi:hypothetical protein
MAYASGKYSYGLCDYCGQRYPYKILRKNWRGFKVCPSDYEPKEPQLEPLKYRGDAIALLEPRPDRVEPVDVYIGQPGYTYFQSVGSANNVINMRPYPAQDTPNGRGSIGNVFIRVDAPVVLASGVSASGQIGNVVLPNTAVNLTAGVTGAGAVGTVTAEGNSVIIPFAGSVSGSGQLGSVSVAGAAPVAQTGIAATGDVNDVSVSLVLNVPLSGVGGSGTIGTVVVPNASFSVTGVEGTGEVSDPSVTTT